MTGEDAVEPTRNRPARPSLLERAAGHFAIPARDAPRPVPVDPAVAEPVTPSPAVPAPPVAEPVTAPVPDPVARPRKAPMPSARIRPADIATIDRDALAERGMLVPGGPVNSLAEEFRLVKRQLLATAERVAWRDAGASRLILICSAQPGDGKTFCSINLALSLAAERDMAVLLIDADFHKPEVLDRMGVKPGRGLLDALADPTIDPETLVIVTDVPQLSLLPAGSRSHDDTELLRSERARAVLDRLLESDPDRIILFDSPPALAASSASVLAALVGQTVLVVRADRSSEVDVREAVALLDGCEEIQLLLNATTYRTQGARFGYYGLDRE
ncbi:AAA family ATPase [Sphingomonas silueang]|uniref:AAA family ATPase n=1 Tax=Sphingomonas silueang TaxID=3156617 RepID=UPI0032B38EF8